MPAAQRTVPAPEAILCTTTVQPQQGQQTGTMAEHSSRSRGVEGERSCDAAGWLVRASLPTDGAPAHLLRFCLLLTVWVGNEARVACGRIGQAPVQTVDVSAIDVDGTRLVAVVG